MELPIKDVHIVKKRLADGSIREYHYHRKTRGAIDAKAKASPQAYLQAVELAAKQPARRGGLPVFRDLAENYKASPEFAKLAPATQKGYSRLIAQIVEKWGNAPLSIFEDKRIRQALYKWRDEMAANSPRQADYVLSVLKAICSFSFERGSLGINHAAGIGRVYKADRSECLWTPELVRTLLAASDDAMSRAIMAALITGQRRGDLLAATWQTNIRNGQLYIEQGKTGAKVLLPISWGLAAALGEPKPAGPLLISPYGAPWKDKQFDHCWAGLMERSGISADLHFHDFRGTLVTELADHECSEAEIAAITGHKATGQVRSLTNSYLSRTAKQAGNAYRKAQPSWIAAL